LTGWLAKTIPREIKNDAVIINSIMILPGKRIDFLNITFTSLNYANFIRYTLILYLSDKKKSIIIVFFSSLE
jgi:hypothetical protein